MSVGEIGLPRAVHGIDGRDRCRTVMVPVEAGCLSYYKGAVLAGSSLELFAQPAQ